MSTIGDLICFSQLRWGFIFQRPNHLIGRFARDRRAFFFEEPVHDAARPELEIREVTPSLRVLVPHLRPGASAEVAIVQQREMLHGVLRELGVRRPALWFYTPMALAFASALDPAVTIYDCMDELSAFKGAPAAMTGMEDELLARADVVFTGGQRLYEHKRGLHPNVHAFPSSVEMDHFARARAALPEPSDQASLRRPRVGYFGAIDERIDLALLERLADELPDWEVVMLGPVVKIDPASLPRRPNLHYLGLKTYEALPAYLSGWDVAMMPFALNDATRFISPTKTLEYLAGGKPVVSTAIHDVVHPYGDRSIVTIADATTFARSVVAAASPMSGERRAAVDDVLARTSWDTVAREMWSLVERAARPHRVPMTNGEASCSTI